eukprot:360434-Chlamydomonas_euryale.AAC.4
MPCSWFVNCQPATSSTGRYSYRHPAIAMAMTSFKSRRLLKIIPTHLPVQIGECIVQAGSQCGCRLDGRLGVKL